MTSLIILFSIHMSNGNISENKNTVMLDGYNKGVMSSFTGYKVPLLDKENNPVYLEYNTADNLKNLIAAAAQDGYAISINNGFRDNEEQKELYYHRHRKGIPIAKPGFSNHQRGTAIDIAGCTNNGKATPLYWWLRKNAHKFGFKNTVHLERWHWEYIE
jgi:LAS superfamily LD-carboxypeptidase LdcB